MGWGGVCVSGGGGGSEGTRTEERGPISKQAPFPATPFPAATQSRLLSPHPHTPHTQMPQTTQTPTWLSSTLKAGSSVLTVCVSEMATAANDRLAATCPMACMDAGPAMAASSSLVMGCGVCRQGGVRGGGESVHGGGRGEGRQAEGDAAQRLQHARRPHDTCTHTSTP